MNALQVGESSALTGGKNTAVSLGVQVSTSLDDPAWDSFLSGVPDVHVEQTSAWARVRAAYGRQVSRLVVREGDRIVGGAQLIVRVLGRWGRVGFLPRGPVVHPGNVTWERLVLRELDRLARRLRLFYLTVDLPYGAARLANEFRSAGYESQPAWLQPTQLLKGTLVLDVQRTDDELLAGMNTSTRRNIRLSQRQGFTVEPGQREHLGIFRELMCATCHRRGVPPAPSEPDFFHHLWDHFAGRGWMRLLMVRKGGEMVSGAVIFTFGDLLRVWKVGWSGHHGSRKPNEFMWWEAIHGARRDGFKALDFYWVNDADVPLVEAGETRVSAFHDGTTPFKLGFGGRFLKLPVAVCRFHQPLARLLWGCGAGRLLGSARLQRAISPILRRFYRRERAVAG